MMKHKPLYRLAFYKVAFNNIISIFRRDFLIKISPWIDYNNRPAGAEPITAGFYQGDLISKTVFFKAFSEGLLNKGSAGRKTACPETEHNMERCISGEPFFRRILKSYSHSFKRLLFNFFMIGKSGYSIFQIFFLTHLNLLPVSTGISFSFSIKRFNYFTDFWRLYPFIHFSVYRNCRRKTACAETSSDFQ